MTTMMMMMMMMMMMIMMMMNKKKRYDGTRGPNGVGSRIWVLCLCTFWFSPLAWVFNHEKLEGWCHSESRRHVNFEDVNISERALDPRTAGGWDSSCTLGRWAQRDTHTPSSQPLQRFHGFPDVSPCLSVACLHNNSAQKLWDLGCLESRGSNHGWRDSRHR